MSSVLTPDKSATLLAHLHCDHSLPPGMRTVAKKLESSLKYPALGTNGMSPSQVPLGLAMPATSVQTPATPKRKRSFPTAYATPTTQHNLSDVDPAALKRKGKKCFNTAQCTPRTSVELQKNIKQYDQLQVSLDRLFDWQRSVVHSLLLLLFTCSEALFILRNYSLLV
ncbi:hypothetical protein B0H34DRAFT_755235 [Crassisporium funariophilum]|nr:hypothetical protein B0H34DRAFT_755235 [Crassisporium funariophilum]